MNALFSQHRIPSLGPTSRHARYPRPDTAFGERLNSATLTRTVTLADVY